MVDWVRAAVAPAGTPPPGGDYSFDQGGFPDFNHETHGGGVMASQVCTYVHGRMTKKGGSPIYLGLLLFKSVFFFLKLPSLALSTLYSLLN